MSSYLKQARIESGKTLEEISNYLKIRKQYLMALEEEDFSSMPAEVYVKGYLKIYANYLGVVIDSITDNKENSSQGIIHESYPVEIDYKWKKQLIIISILMLIIIFMISH